MARKVATYAEKLEKECQEFDKQLLEELQLIRSNLEQLEKARWGFSAQDLESLQRFIEAEQIRTSLWVRYRTFIELAQSRVP